MVWRLLLYKGLKLTKEIGNSQLLDTWAATGTIVEPSETKKNVGWELQEQPPHEFANWLANTIGKAVNHILQNGVPAHNVETAYLTGNIVQVGGTLYKAKADNVNSTPPNVNWQKIAPYPIKNSITDDGGALQLAGDNGAPGVSKYYGTNAAGEKGFHTVINDSFETGDLKLKYGGGILAGYVRLNGRTLGKAGSGATERANADTESLFVYLYNTDANLSVSGGRGASAGADFAAGKVLTLPDAKNAALASIDGMGGANSNRLTTGAGGVDGKVLGALGGSQTHQLTEAQNAKHHHKVPVREATTQNGGPNYTVGNNSIGDEPSDGSNGEHFTGSSGNGEAHNNVQPTFIFGTVYIKL